MNSVYEQAITKNFQNSKKVFFILWTFPGKKTYAVGV